MRFRSTLLSVSALALATTGIAAGSAWAELEEIVVTAQKREQSLQDVPISISAFSGDAIEKRSVDSLADLSASIPNLTIGETQIDTRISIRGIRTGANKGFEQSVAMYVDGLYYGRSQLIRLPLVDLARVEVLRGPQPTLFGKNAIAGAVSVVSNAPTDEFEGSLSVGYEFEHEEKQAVGILSGPIGESLNGRMVVSYRELGGYFENVTLGKDWPNKEETFLRGTLAWDNGGNLRVSLKGEYAHFDTDGRALENNTPVGAYSLIFAGPLAVETVEDWRSESSATDSLNKVKNFVLNADYDIGELTLTSITGYVKYDTTEVLDVDYTAIDLLDGTNQAEHFDQFSQEIRLTSPAGQKVDYILGAYYQSNDLTVTDEVFFGSAFLAFGAPFAFIADSNTDRLYSQDSSMWSIFAQTDIHFTDAMTLTLGGRYSDEDKDAERTLTFVDGPTNTGIGIGPVGPFPSMLHAVLSGLNMYEHSILGSRSETSFNPLVNLQYQWNDSVMTYVSYTQGTKAGGFDIRGNSLPGHPVAVPGTWEFEDEQATSYELGAKIRGDRFDLNINVYQTEYEDLQTSVFDGTLNFAVKNASQVTTQGVEVDGRIQLSDHFKFYGSVAYLDFEFDEFPEGPCAFGVTPDSFGTYGEPFCDFGGNPTSLVPKWSGAAGLDYENGIASGLVLDANLNVDFSSDFFLMENLDANQIQDGFAKLGLQVGIGSEDGTWRISLIGRNLTDERIKTTSGNLPLASTIISAATGGALSGNAYDSFYERPRNIMLKVDYKF